VLNAADARLVEMAELCDGEVIFFGLSADLLAIATHRAAGKRAVFVCATARWCWPPATARPALDRCVGDSADSRRTRVAFQIENVLAAVDTGWALGGFERPDPCRHRHVRRRPGGRSGPLHAVRAPWRYRGGGRRAQRPALEALAAARPLPSERRMLVFGAGCSVATRT
jgi:cyanophycin synthetase